MAQHLFMVALVAVGLLLLGCAPQDTNQAPAPLPDDPAPVVQAAESTPSPTATSTPSPTPDYMAGYQAVLDDMGVTDPTDEQLADACIIHEYLGWPYDIDEYQASYDAEVRGTGLVGQLLEGQTPRYSMDVGYITAAMSVLPGPERKKFCQQFR